jgi:hypothetical protein
MAATACDLACFDESGDPVFVLPSGLDEHGVDRLITIGVRDSDIDGDADTFRREHCRDLIDLDPVDAIRLARYLLDYATDMLDATDDDEASR